MNIKYVWWKLFDPSGLLDIHAIFTVTLQLPIESAPASLRGKPEASKASNQGWGVGGCWVRVAVRFPLQGTAQLLHLDHVHTSMFHHRESNNRGGFSTSRGNNRTDTNFPRSRSRFFSVETAVGFRLDPTKPLPRSFYNHVYVYVLHTSILLSVWFWFSKPSGLTLREHQGRSSCSEILMYLKSLLKGSSPLLSFPSVTSYSTEKYYLSNSRLVFLCLSFASAGVGTLINRVIAKEFFLACPRPFLLSFCIHWHFVGFMD